MSRPIGPGSSRRPKRDRDSYDIAWHVDYPTVTARCAVVNEDGVDLRRHKAGRAERESYDVAKGLHVTVINTLRLRKVFGESNLVFFFCYNLQYIEKVT